MSDTAAELPSNIKKQNSKKQASYTYWVDDKNKSRQLPPQQRPKKIEAPINLEHHKSQQKPSAWNSCGTWEQKKVPLKEIQENLTVQIKEWLQKNEVSEIQLDNVDLEGEVHKIFKRQKWNLMYEIKGKVSFKKDDKKGKVNLQDLTDHGDREFSISGDQQIKKVLRTKAQKVVQILEAIITKYKN